MNHSSLVAALKTAEPIKIMEVCGTHTSAIYKSGIRSLISSNITLVSGPGCPVCVTPASAIDSLITHAENSVVLSFGDMFRVPGSRYCLAQVKAQGARVQLIYSPLEALTLAKARPDTKFIIAAVGFETTAPIYAAIIEACILEDIRNISLHTSLKTIPEALAYICAHEQIDAFICPGHVSAVIGSAPYQALAEKYRKPFVIAGFEAEHILAAIFEALIQKKTGRYEVKNLYPSVVRDSGQTKALSILEKYFEKTNSFWRGIGEIENSGYVIKKEYERFSANNLASAEEDNLPEGCRCADVMLGRIMPGQCALFGNECTPQTPVGPCMASSEGACGIYVGEYKHPRRGFHAPPTKEA